MADDETRRPMSGVPEFDSANEALEERGNAFSEGGRPEEFEPSPEGRLMRSGTVTSSNPAPLTPDTLAEASKEIDDRAASDAANDVRRREHSAD